MNIELECPLGSKCERIGTDKNGNPTIIRCRAYTKIAGVNPNTGEQVDEFKCSVFEWQPILLLEIASVLRGNQASIESFRNETVKGQNNFLFLAQAAMQNKLIKKEE